MVLQYSAFYKAESDSDSNLNPLRRRPRIFGTMSFWEGGNVVRAFGAVI